MSVSHVDNFVIKLKATWGHGLLINIKFCGLGQNEVLRVSMVDDNLKV